jgi:hypothetical protein
MQQMPYRFPFGRPVTPCAPSANSRRTLFVLGAYPSALHIRWRPPRKRPGGRIKAIAVDNEPEPFWNGDDAAERVEHWRARVAFDDSWGEVDVPAGINGPSGAWVDSQILAKFGLGRADTWITDCLDTYRVSNAGAGAIERRFVPFAIDADLQIPHLASHPSESQIVTEALQPRRAAALCEQLRRAAPDTIVTLGNAALRVMRKLAEECDQGDAGDRSTTAPTRDPGTGLRLDNYGERCIVTVHERKIAWYPLAHPAAPAAYQTAHEAWEPDLSERCGRAIRRYRLGSTSRRRQ